MIETCLARIEQPQQKRKRRNTMDLSPWSASFEASCWFRTSDLHPEETVMLVAEYADSIDEYRIEIDSVRPGFLQDCLVSGRFQIRGMGELSNAKVVLYSKGKIGKVDLTLKEVSSDAEREFKLIA